MDKLEEFKNDLFALFEKHNILVLKDSVSMEQSPLFCTNIGKTRKLIFRFEQLLSREEALEHYEKYGCVISEYDRIRW